MKVGDEVYLNPKSEYSDGTKDNPLDTKGKITNIYGRIYILWENGRANCYDEEDLILAPEYGVPAMNQGHPSADILMEIAKEAAVNEEYWKEFEVKAPNNCWYPMDGADISLVDFIRHPLRRKPRTIRIGDYDVPEPIRNQPKTGSWYFSVECLTDGVWHREWAGDYRDDARLKAGLVHETREGAELMLKALQELLCKK